MTDSQPTTGTQIRMARAALGWSVSKLAKRAGLDPSTVKRVEANLGMTNSESDLEWRARRRADSVEAIGRALVNAGISFLPDNGKGVGLRAKHRVR